MTYARPRPTLADVSTLAQSVVDDTVTVTLNLPRECVEWLDVEAIRRKYASHSSKAAKAPIVVELIREEIKRREKKA